MNIPISVIITIVMGSVGLGSALVTVGIYIGGFKSKFVLKTECADNKKGCSMRSQREDENMNKKFEQMEKSVEHKIELLEEKHDNILNEIFHKLDRVFQQMEDLKVNFAEMKATIQK